MLWAYLFHLLYDFVLNIDILKHSFYDHVTFVKAFVGQGSI